MQNQYLFVTTDIAPFRALYPVAQKLTALGHQISIASNGKSLNEWHKTEFATKLVAEPFDTTLILEHKCVSVLIGLSSPIGIEDEFAKTANNHRIPVVSFSDTWGATSRLKLGKPDMVLTIDNIDNSITKGYFPTAQIITVGDWINSPIENPPTIGDPDLHLLFIAGQNPATIEEFVRVSLGLMMEPNSWQVVFKPHPKYADAPETKRAETLLDQSKVKLIKTSASSDEVAAVADITVSGFSGILRVAALNGKTGVSIETKACMEQMKKSTGLLSYPLVQIGACTSSNEIQSLEDLLMRHQHLTTCSAYRHSIWPHKLDEAVQAILALG